MTAAQTRLTAPTSCAECGGIVPQRLAGRPGRNRRFCSKVCCDRLNGRGREPSRIRRERVLRVGTVVARTFARLQDEAARAEYADRIVFSKLSKYRGVWKFERVEQWLSRYFAD